MSTNKRLLMDKIIDILDSIAYEKGLKIDDVENALKEALIKTAQKMVDETLTFDANIDRANKKLELFQKIEVVNQDDERLLANAVNKYGEALNFENYMHKRYAFLLGLLLCLCLVFFTKNSPFLYFQF